MNEDVDCLLRLGVGVETLLRSAAAHEVAVVAATGVVGDEPRVELGLELGEPVEADLHF